MAQRPASVSLVVFLIWLSALLSIIFGVWALVAASDIAQSTGTDALTIRIQGGFEIAIGLILALIASALSHGSRVARIIVSVVMLLDLIFGVLAAITAWGELNGYVGLVSAVLAVFILWLLWNAKAGAFFAGGQLVKD